jgi:glyoxylase-like metal-dependent hydrolase (beta-lactamase superfamily II)
MRRRAFGTFVVAAFVSAAVGLAAQQPQAPGGAAPGQGEGRRGGGPGGPGGPGGGGRGPAAPPAIKEVKPGLYMVTGVGGNSTVRVTTEGIIVVDTKNMGEANYNALMEQIRTVSKAPVRYAFVTHHHQDHSGNIGPFQASGTEVIVHEGLNKALDTYKSNAGTPEKSKVTYTTNRTVKVGNASAEARYFGRAHTSGDSWVYFPDVRVVATGDSFVATAPNCDYPFGGSVVEWVKTLDQVLKLDFDTAIPGHGNDPMTKADVQKFRDNLNTIVTRARELVKKGVPKEQLFAQLKTDDIGWNINTQQWTQPARLDPFYDELSK